MTLTKAKLVSGLSATGIADGDPDISWQEPLGTPNRTTLLPSASVALEVTGVLGMELDAISINLLTPGDCDLTGAEADVAASYALGSEGADNGLTLTMKAAGHLGNDYKVVVTAPGANATLLCTLVSKTITIRPATNGSSAITSTSAQVKAALEASSAISALVTVAHTGASDGTGVLSSSPSTAASFTGGVTACDLTGGDGYTFEGEPPAALAAVHGLEIAVTSGGCGSVAIGGVVMPFSLPEGGVLSYGSPGGGGIAEGTGTLALTACLPGTTFTVTVFGAPA